jgi:hypothetical protein
LEQFGFVGILFAPLEIVIPSEVEGPAVRQAQCRMKVPEFVLLPGKCGSLLRKDKRRMNCIHAGPFDCALRAPLRMTILMDWLDANKAKQFSC